MPIQTWKDAPDEFAGQSVQLFPGLRLYCDGILATQLPALDEVGLHLFERDAFLVAARLRDQDILNVLPQGLVFLRSMTAAVLRPLSSVMNWIPVMGRFFLQCCSSTLPRPVAPVNSNGHR